MILPSIIIFSYLLPCFSHLISFPFYIFFRFPFTFLFLHVPLFVHPFLISLLCSFNFILVFLPSIISSFFSLSIPYCFLPSSSHFLSSPSLFLFFHSCSPLPFLIASLPPLTSPPFSCICAASPLPCCSSPITSRLQYGGKSCVWHVGWWEALHLHAHGPSSKYTHTHI